MATTVSFHFNVADRMLYACRIVRKSLANSMTVGVWSEDAGALRLFSSRLWSFDDLGFFPHTDAEDSAAEKAPVIYSSDVDLLIGRDILINLGEGTPEPAERLREFKKIFEIVPSDEAAKISARRRFSAYRRAGFEPVAFDTKRT